MRKFNDIQEESKVIWNELTNREMVVYIGSASCGKAAGADEIISAMQNYLRENELDIEVVSVGCIGMCCYEPIIYIQAHGNAPVAYGNLEPDKLPVLLDEVRKEGKYENEMLLGVIGEGFDKIPSIFIHSMLKKQKRVVLKNCGIIDPTNIDHYIAHDGYLALEKTLKMKPEDIIQIVKDSGIRGRGGGGFSTGLKWQLCRQEKSDKKYVVCNADEGDPGAFMDRSILEANPHSVMEGMMIAGYAVGASEGYLYVRAEYPLAIKRLKIAIKQAEDYGLSGENVLSSGFNFIIHLFEGAGAFVCGEETALMASIEGKRGTPRHRPPFPAKSGLWGKPTTINNVKTMAFVPKIIRNGATWFADIGTEKSKGTAVFALAGKVKNSGLIEVPMGMTLREIIYGIGGGIIDDKAFKAVQTGGPSGGCIPAKHLNSMVDYESLQALGSIMGSGGMVVMDENTCMVDVARYFLDFTQKESCGKCVPCRLGTKQMLEILKDITKGKGEPGDIDLLLEYGEAIKKGSLCGLGQTAPNPVLTTIHYFRDEYEAHINENRCPGLVCNAFLQYRIIPEKCKGCQLCLKRCPSEAISGKKKEPHKIEPEKCIKCGMCLEVCPDKFSAVECVSLGKGDEEGDDTLA